MAALRGKPDFGVGVRGPTEIPRLLVHLGGDAQIPRLLVGLRRAPELALLAEDAAGGFALAGLEVELGGFDEAVLVVADLRRALEILVLDEVLRGLFEEAVREAVLRRFGVRGPPSPGRRPASTAFFWVLVST